MTTRSLFALGLALVASTAVLAQPTPHRTATPLAATDAAANADHTEQIARWLDACGASSDAQFGCSGGVCGVVEQVDAAPVVPYLRRPMRLAEQALAAATGDPSFDTCASLQQTEVTAYLSLDEPDVFCGILGAMGTVEVAAGRSVCEQLATVAGHPTRFWAPGLEYREDVLAAGGAR